MNFIHVENNTALGGLLVTMLVSSLTLCLAHPGTC